MATKEEGCDAYDDAGPYTHGDVALVCRLRRANLHPSKSQDTLPHRQLPALPIGSAQPYYSSTRMLALRRWAQRATLAYLVPPPPPTTALRCRRFLSDVARPWFVDPEPVNPRQVPPHLLPKSHDLPLDLPVPVKVLFHTLSQSPFLEPSTLEVREPFPIPPGPPLPKTIPKGRRGRGRTYSGEGTAEDQGGIWNWVVTAQV